MQVLILITTLAAGANWQMVETFHHGSIFEKFRAQMEVREGFIPELLSCPFCLSHWTAAGFTALVLACHPVEGWMYLAPIIWLTIVRMSNVMNDVGHRFCRSPKNPVIEEELAALDDIGQPEENGRDEKS